MPGVDQCGVNINGKDQFDYTSLIIVSVTPFLGQPHFSRPLTHGKATWPRRPFIRLMLSLSLGWLMVIMSWSSCCWNQVRVTRIR